MDSLLNLMGIGGINFNGVNVIYYLFSVLLAVITSYFIQVYNKKVFDKEVIEQRKEDTENKKQKGRKEIKESDKQRERTKKNKVEINLLVVLVNILIYLGLLYRYGLTLEALKFFILIPMLISALIIDFKLQIIPNRLNLTMFEIGIVLTFIYSFIDINIAIDNIFGMLAGGGIFLLITLIGGAIAGKEAMGFGDVKLMGALGLFFGLKSIIMVTVLAFLIGAVISVIILIIRAKKKSEYIPFGPFIVIAAIVTIFVPQAILFDVLITVFSLGLNKRNVV